MYCSISFLPVNNSRDTCTVNVACVAACFDGDVVAVTIAVAVPDAVVFAIVIIAVVMCRIFQNIAQDHSSRITLYYFRNSLPLN